MNRSKNDQSTMNMLSKLLQAFRVLIPVNMSTGVKSQKILQFMGPVYEHIVFSPSSPRIQ